MIIVCDCEVCKVWLINIFQWKLVLNWIKIKCLKYLKNVSYELDVLMEKQCYHLYFWISVNLIVVLMTLIINIMAISTTFIQNVISRQTGKYVRKEIFIQNNNQDSRNFTVPQQLYSIIIRGNPEICEFQQE